MPRTEDNNIDGRLKELIEFAKSVDLEEVSMEQDGVKMSFKRYPGKAEIPQAEETGTEEEQVEPPKSFYITSPMVGTFLRSSAKDRPPMIVEGSMITPGQKVGSVEAMNIFKDVVSNFSGRIVRILVENGRPVEYGQHLFEVEVSENV